MKQVMAETPEDISSAFKLDVDGNFKMFPTKTVRVKLKPGKNLKYLSDVLRDFDIADIEEKYGVFRVYIDDIRQVFKIANTLYESGIAEFSLPDFYIEKTLNQVDDPLFPLQFQMNNTGQVIDGIPGVHDIDCNALEAWDMAMGNNITIAVLDEGLEAHEDFGSRLIGGHTPANNGNGTPVTNAATHGMNSAGVAAASHNNLGIRGVAPNANLLSVNIFVGATIGEAADGIMWAVNNGADVLNNSWGFRDQPCGFTNADIDNAIQYAVTEGRNGDGCVVVFAAGNQGGCVEYPASNPNVIAVGAIDNQGNQYGYSARGAELDLVAPSGRTNYLGNIRTLDRMENSGRLVGSYEDSFGGTSAACPVVSGTAALVLSVNPNLTQQQVRDLLFNTATDMGPNGFDNNFGNGRVNAYAAVLGAMGDNSIFGPDSFCSSATYTLDPVAIPSGATITWEASPNYLFVNSSGSGSSATLQSSSSGEGQITFQITMNGNDFTVSKEIQFGSPIITAEGYRYNNSPTYPLNPYYSVPNNQINEVPAYVTADFSFKGSTTSSQVQIIDQSDYSMTWNVAAGTNQLSLGFDFYGPMDPLGPQQQWVIFRITAQGGCGNATYDVGFYWQGSGTYLVYPNPADDTVTILHQQQELTLGTNYNNETQSIRVKLLNFKNQLVYQKENVLGKNSMSIETSSLPSGIYFLQIEKGKEKFTKKIIIEH